MDMLRYKELNWGNGYEKWELCRLATPMDGSCLFHAIAYSFFEPYRNELLNGQKIKRNEIVRLLRKELSDTLDTKISGGSKTYYQLLNNGNTEKFSKSVTEFTLKYMKDELNSNNYIGYGYMEYIGYIINKDIYILEDKRHDIYVTDELSLTIKGNRLSIVIYYIEGHYELIGVKNSEGKMDTHFLPDHSLIKFLYARVQHLIR